MNEDFASVAWTDRHQRVSAELAALGAGAVRRLARAVRDIRARQPAPDR